MRVTALAARMARTAAAEAFLPIPVSRRVERYYEREARWAGFAGRTSMLRRKVAARLLVPLAVLLAAWGGFRIGSGHDTAQGRYTVARIASEAEMPVSYGTPAIPGHPGADVLSQQRRFVRQFMALDRAN